MAESHAVYWQHRCEEAEHKLGEERRKRETAEALAASLQAELDVFVSQARAAVEGRRLSAAAKKVRRGVKVYVAYNKSDWAEAQTIVGVYSSKQLACAAVVAYWVAQGVAWDADDAERNEIAEYDLDDQPPVE